MLEAKSSSETTIDNIYKELADRESRKENLVLYQVAEANEDIQRGQDRKQQAHDTIIEICDTIGIRIDPDNDLKFFARTGEIGQTTIIRLQGHQIAEHHPRKCKKTAR